MSPVDREVLAWLRRTYTPVEEGGLFKTRQDGVVPEETLARCHPEIEWRPHLVGRVEGRAYRGHAGMPDWSQDMADTFEEMRPRIHELIPAEEDRVLVILTLGFRGRGSGVFTELRLGHLWTFHNGLAVRFESFPESEARAAAGL